jgi:hypothetical protein
MELKQEKIFFIIAPPRSGTTLLQGIMNTFSGFCNQEESRIAGGNSPSCWQFVIRDDDFLPLEKFIREKWNKEYFVEKSPPSIFCLPQIQKRFPNSNYIFLERNPNKILHSILNLFFGMSQIGRRKDDLGNLINNDRTVLKFEEARTRQLLKMITSQVRYKPLFKNQITIKYEDFLEEPERNISLIEEKFGLQANLEKAKKILDRPSGSSNFRYWYKELSNEKASALIRLSCKLWGYE